MSQDSQAPNEDRVPGANGAPQSDAGAAGQMGEQVTQDVGGAQGSAPEEEGEQTDASPMETGSPPDRPVPDAGEIEWAGQVVKKPPTAQA